MSTNSFFIENLIIAQEDPLCNTEIKAPKESFDNYIKSRRSNISEE